MRVIIFGSRTLRSPETVETAIRELEVKHGRLVSVVIEGGQVTYVGKEPSHGADYLAKKWAEANGIPVEEYRPDWVSFGKAAGPIRNQKMVDEAGADAALALWDGASRGTRDMIRRVENARIPLHVFIFRENRLFRGEN